MDKTKESRSILAYQMNGDGLPVGCGAPRRVRSESQSGNELDEWVDRGEFVDDLGTGEGGWHDDGPRSCNAPDT